MQGENIIVINKTQTNIELTSPLLGIRSENYQLNSGIPPLTIQIDEGIPADAGIHSRHEAFPHFDVEHATRFAGRVDRDDPGLYILLYSAGFWSETTPVAVLAAVEEGKIYLVTYPAPRWGGGGVIGGDGKASPRAGVARKAPPRAVFWPRRRDLGSYSTNHRHRPKVPEC